MSRGHQSVGFGVWSRDAMLTSIETRPEGASTLAEHRLDGLLHYHHGHRTPGKHRGHGRA